MKRAVLILLAACSGAPPDAAPTPRVGTPRAAAAPDPIDAKLDEVARIHGAPGPWAVLGYRMSEYALGKLSLPRGSYDVEIAHWTPKAVRYACIADGAAAHSGASLGKLNLTLVEATEDNLLTIYRNKKSGAAVALKPSATFRDRFGNGEGRAVMSAPDEQLFEEVNVQR